MNNFKYEWVHITSGLSHQNLIKQVEYLEQRGYIVVTIDIVSESILVKYETQKIKDISIVGAVVALQKCLFCKNDAYLITRPYEGDSSKGCDYFDIGCKTKDCHLEDGADYYFPTIEEAVESWHNRK